MAVQAIVTYISCLCFFPFEMAKTISHFRVVLYLIFKTSPSANNSNGNVFVLYLNEHMSKTHFHVQGVHQDSFRNRGKRQPGNGL